MVIVDEHYITVAKAAELLRVSRSTLWRWIEAEKLPAYRFGHRRVLIKRDDLAGLITPLKGEKGEVMAIRERERLNRPLTKQQQKEALAALEAARQLKAQMLQRRGGKLFSDSTEIIRVMRQERTSNL